MESSNRTLGLLKGRYMTQIEAMEKALEVLLSLDNDLIVEVTKLNSAIDALDDALEYAKSEWPIAWMNEEGDVTTCTKWSQMQKYTIPLFKTPQAQSKPDDTCDDPCPDCGKQLQVARGGGVKCSCGYWFCF